MSFLQSIFGNDATSGGYPEDLVKAAIERAVDGTDPWIRALSGYQRMLRPAVLRAIDHVVALVDGLAPAIVIDAGSYGRDPRLRTFFISGGEMKKVIDHDRSLTDFRRGQSCALPRVHALLAMEKQEKTILGTALSGEIILRDVRQTTVSFEGHRFFDLAENEDETRRQIKRRAFDHLLSLALSRISIVKTERDNLERYRALLQSKLGLLRRGGWAFDKILADESQDVADMEKQLAQIEQQFQELGKDDRLLEIYIDILIDILGRPEKHLWVKKERLIIDRMGIKRNEVAGDAPEVTFDVLQNSEDRSLVVALVTLSEEVVQPN